jgi:hypothetical protein
MEKTTQDALPSATMAHRKLRTLIQCKMPQSTRKPLRVVTEPVRDWHNLHNLIGGSQKITNKVTTPQKATKRRLGSNDPGETSFG